MNDVPEFVSRLFDGTANQQDLEVRISESIERFLAATAVSTDVDFDALSAQFTCSTVPEREADIESYFRKLGDVVGHSINISSPNYMGHMTSALPYFVRPVSQLIAGLNQNLVKVETAKSLTPCERESLAMIHRVVYGEGDDFYARHIQNRESTLGIVTSGGTLANVTGLWIARNQALGPDGAFPGVERAGLAAALEHHRARRAVVIGSTLMHYSLEKAVDILGLGVTDGLVRVPVGASGRVDPNDVRAAVRACTERGDRVIAIVGIAGTTDSGAIDPLLELAAIARESKAHFHVDAAWGGPLLFSKKHRHALAGIELADSVTIDGHKQLYLPMGIGMLMLRDPRSARAIEKSAQYIIRSGSADLGRRSLEGSRPAMVLHLHAALHLIGAAGYEWLIDEGIRKARALVEMLRERDEFELLVDPQMNIVNYRYLPASLREKARALSLTDDEQSKISRVNESLQERQSAAGEHFVSRTTLRFTRHGLHRPVASLRAVLANPLTSQEHIAEMLDMQAGLGKGLS